MAAEVSARRKWTEARLQWVREQWKTRTLPEIAAELDIPLGTLKSACSAYGIRCPVDNGKGRRRRYGPVSLRERAERRRWYRMWRGLRVRGMSTAEAMAELRAAGCTLSRRQIWDGWRHYRETHLSGGRD
jgi:hypothetical protein